MKTNTKILIAEDNVMNQRLIKHLMNNWNFNFDLVFNGAQVLEALKKQHYDLILMDIQMPEMDGYEATQIIRHEMMAEFNNIPIIALTASALIADQNKCLVAGMNDFIAKPYLASELYKKILLQLDPSCH